MSELSQGSLRRAGVNGPTVMLAGILLFSLNDAMGKWLVASYSVGQVVMIRSLAALIVLAPFLWRAGPKTLFQVEKPIMQATRVFLSTAEVFSFYFAVMYLPLADVMTYWLAAPIYVAAASPLLLGEKVGWRRWTAIVLGFIGVLVALNPSRQMLTAPAMISVGGTLAFAFMMLSGRSLRGTPDKTLVFFQTSGALAAGLVASFYDWKPLASTTDLMLIMLLGVVAMSAHILVNRALKLSDAATVAPLQYALLFFAILFGWLFFGDIPRLNVLAGAALIVGSGLFIFYREQRLKRRTTATTSVSTY